MFDRLEKTILDQSCKWLEGLRNKYLREDTVAVFFKTKYISIFNCSYILSVNCLSFKRKYEDLKPTARVAPSPISPSNSWSPLHLIQMMTGLTMSQSSPPQKESKLQCDVCNVVFSGPESQNQHNSSEKHKKKMQQATASSQNAANQSSLPGKDSKLECLICNVSFTGPESQKQHNDSEKHKKKASQMSNDIQNPKFNATIQQKEVFLSCDICNMSFSGPESQKQHNDSEKHKKKASQMSCGFVVITQNQKPHAPQQKEASLSCNICSMTFTGPESKEQHLGGEKHKKKLQQKLDEAKLKETSQQKTSVDQGSVLRCKPCNVICTSEVSLAEHMASRNHAKMISV